MISEGLKQRVLFKAGVASMSASDCGWIASEIYKTLNKEISVTTLKRVFGFARSNHHFSKYTLITLREYANLASVNMMSHIKTEGTLFLAKDDQQVLRPDHLVIQALEILLEHHKESLPIVKQGKYIGCCYIRDLIYFLTCEEKTYGTLFHKFNFTLESAIFILERSWA